MEDEKEIVNRVASSGLITLDLEELYDKTERALIDIKDNLFQGLILKEKDFREFIKAHDWEQYKGKLVAVTCTADAVIPVWAYMLLSTRLEPYAKEVVFGDMQQLEHSLFQKALDQMSWEKFKDAKVVIKGCSNFPVPPSAYMEAARRLRPFAQSIMYGEPCSTVPVYKKSK